MAATPAEVLSAKGHLLDDLPVVLVFFTRTGEKRTIAPGFRRNDVNQQVARHHNLNGWGEEPPYFADHTSSVPSYRHPRDTSLLARQAARDEDKETVNREPFGAES
ncbi:MAG: hypothetical protein M1837_005617 [Sclerophora amabilis]|nr:MAG: hypothetical protein M1837_005617 [Sclerophora amabilis]